MAQPNKNARLPVPPTPVPYSSSNAPHPESVPEGFAVHVTKTVRDRGSNYGHPQDNHALTAEMWTAWLRRRFPDMPVEFKLSAEDVCMLNVLQKSSRLAFDTKNDSWLDIAGYSENVAMLRSDQRNERQTF